MARTSAGSSDFASWRRALAQCPRCGLIYPYTSLRKDGQTENMVCPECWDPKHPQETPVLVRDAIALEHPRTITDDLDEEAVDLTDEDGFESTFDGAGATLFEPLGAEFAGVGNYMLRGANLTGLQNGSQGTLSFWMRMDAGNSGIFASNSGSGVGLELSATRFLSITLSASASVTLSFLSAQALTISSTWRHVLMSWDTAYSAGNKDFNIYMDDEVLLGTVTDDDDTFDIPYASKTNWAIGTSVALPSFAFNGALAEFWFDTTYLDFSITGNRRKFITAAGRPADLGPNGGSLTGYTPVIYQSVRPNGSASDFATNRGTGGDFTVTGSLDLSSTNPGD